MDETPAELRRRLFDAAARTRKQRQEPPAPEGITSAEMYTIMAVSRLEGEGRSVRSGDIAKCGHATPSAVSQILKSLEEKGLITRQRDKGDSRAVTVHLTKDGRAFSARGREVHEQMIDGVLAYLGSEDAEHFVRIMERLADFPASEVVRAQQKGCAQVDSSAAGAGASPACATGVDKADAVAGDSACAADVAVGASASSQASSAKRGVTCA